MSNVKQVDNHSVESALEFIDVSVATLQQVHNHLEMMKNELDALKNHGAKADPSRLSDRVQALIVTLAELQRKWEIEVAKANNSLSC